MPTIPTPIQNTFKRMYAGSFLIMEHQESMNASHVLNAHTKKKGLLGPSQLTNEKLKILISTPVISTARMFRETALFNLLWIIVIS